MSDVPQGEGYWQASDGLWYPPTEAPGPEPAGPTAPPAGAPPGAAPGPAPGAAPPGPGWWQASDGNWYPPQQAPGGYPAPGMPGYDPQAKSKMAAGLLGIFLGGFGVHRFYLGYTQIGVVQIIVTIVTCGLGSIWGFIEGILILVGNEGFRTDADGRPLRD